jgi:DNA-directed RNA polymerase subunit E'/Rpb7
MKTNLISPYNKIIQYSKVQLKPHQLNSDIEQNMELNLRNKVEKKCNKYGFIDKIYKIISYEDGEMKRENLSGFIDYKVTYECNMCIPIENTLIVAKILSINQELIMASNGPIIIFIPKNNIDTNTWKYDSNYINKQTDQPLEINNLVKILILKTKINQNDTQIKVIGKVLELGTKEEILTYYNNKEEEIKEDNFII